MMDILNVQDEFNLRDYINVVLRRKNVIILFFITIVLAVTVGSFLMTPIYRAKTTIFIDLENPNVLTSSGILEIQSQNYYSYKEYYQSQKEILTSLPIVQKVFDDFGLINLPGYSGAKEPVKRFLKSIKVEPVRDTRLVELYVENPDPVLAAKMANRIAEIYVRRNQYYISKNELLNLLKNEYLKLEGKLSEYTKIYKEAHPEMIRLRKEIAEVVDKIEKEKKADFDQDYNAVEELLNYKYALEGLKANNISVLAPAEVPIVPVKPKKLINMMLAVLIGLFGGIGLAFIFDYLDDTIKETSDLERLTKWPFLGSIPKIDLDGLTERERDVFVHTKPREPAAEAYRSVRTSVLFSATEEHPSRAIVITSPAPQEGKTTTLCNLGIAMAQNRSRVLLVDADMRNPRLNEVFKLENTKGLSTFLSNQAQFDEVIQKTGVDNLFLVPSGIHPPNPSELLASHKMATFVKEAKGKFDFVLFDTPPVLILTDAVILSSFTDGVVVVVEGTKTPKKALPHIYKLLAGVNARVIGIVLNKLSIHSGSYYHRYYSHYHNKTK
jgi:capsular exopolysaccharide synthesis family protein